MREVQRRPRYKDWAGFRGDTILRLDEDNFVVVDGTWCIFPVGMEGRPSHTTRDRLPDDTVVIHQHGTHTTVTTPYIGLIRRLSFLQSPLQLFILLPPRRCLFSCKATVAFTSFKVVLIVLSRWLSTVAPSVTSFYFIGRRWPVIHLVFPPS